VRYRTYNSRKLAEPGIQMVSFNGQDKPNENFLLSALPFEEYQRLLPNLWPTTFSPGSVL
jgi:hypothetical protein